MHRLFLLAALAATVGCTSTSTTNTARSAKEQMLISNAVDQSLNKVDFTPFTNRTVFLDDKYIDGVDKNYVIASIRHRLMRAGAKVVKTADEAELIVEARTGAIGTHSADSFVGVPEITLPGMMSLPEMRLLEKKNQKGIAKIGLVAYDAKTKQALGNGGVSLAESNDSAYFMFGIGPYTGGSINDEIKSGKKASATRATTHQMPQTVAFSAPAQPMPGTSTLHLASGEEKVEKTAEAPAKDPKQTDAPVWAK